MKNSLKNNQSYIYNAILKYGHSNFSLTIIEYCEPEQCLEREDYYLPYLKENNKYNTAKKSSAPMSGRKHSDETKTKISDAITGFKHYEETKK
jgi:group I intron endonuclease